MHGAVKIAERMVVIVVNADVFSRYAKRPEVHTLPYNFIFNRKLLVAAFASVVRYPNYVFMSL